MPSFRGALLLALMALPGCTREPPPPPAPAPDRHADGRSLQLEKQQWRSEWERIAPLVPCEGLPEEDQRACDAVRAARDALRRAEESGDDGALMDAAVRLVRAGLPVRKTLQKRSLAWTLEEQREQARAGASASAAPAGSAPLLPAASTRSVGEVARALQRAHAHHQHQQARDGGNQWERLFRVYDQAVTMGANRLDGYLRIAPLPLRRQALDRLGSLVETDADGPQVRRLVREARASETDSEMIARLEPLLRKVKETGPAD